MNNLPWQIEKIIAVANQLKRNGGAAASTGEMIAAAFVINRPEHLPPPYLDMLEAWDRLGEEWRYYVRLIRQEYMHLIDGG